MFFTIFALFAFSLFLFNIKARRFIYLSFSEFVSDTLSEIEKDEELGPNFKGRYNSLFWRVGLKLFQGTSEMHLCIIHMHL